MFYITDKHCENVNVSSFRRRNKHIFQSSAAQSKTKYAVRFVSQVKGESSLLPGFVLLLLRHQWNAWFSNMFIIHQTHTHTHMLLFITDLKILPWPKRVNKHPCSYVKFELWGSCSHFTMHVCLVQSHPVFISPLGWYGISYFCLEACKRVLNNVC